MYINDFMYRMNITQHIIIRHCLQENYVSLTCYWEHSVRPSLKDDPYFTIWLIPGRGGDYPYSRAYTAFRSYHPKCYLTFLVETSGCGQPPASSDGSSKDAGYHRMWRWSARPRLGGTGSAAPNPHPRGERASPLLGDQDWVYVKERASHYEQFIWLLGDLQ